MARHFIYEKNLPRIFCYYRGKIFLVITGDQQVGLVEIKSLLNEKLLLVCESFASFTWSFFFCLDKLNFWLLRAQAGATRRIAGEIKGHTCRAG